MTSKCHALDRENFVALFDCLGTDDDTILEYASYQFYWDYRSFVQGSEAESCMYAYHPEAPAVMYEVRKSSIKQKLKKALASGLSTFLGVLIFVIIF